MLKRDELENPRSCINRAKDEEMVFVLFARDPAAPATIRAWADERVRLGKNKSADEQIQEAIRCAQIMEQQRAAGIAVSGNSAPGVNVPGAAG